MNTHDKIELPPLPQGEYRLSPDSHAPALYDEEAMEAYASDAVKPYVERINDLEAKNTELEHLCDETFVAQGADTYNHACEVMEHWQAERKKHGKVVGTTGSLCDGIAWLYNYIDDLEADRKQRFGNGDALQRYKECGGDEESDPLERLRFYCSLAMSGQDWLDVEPFFDALVADRQGRMPSDEEIDKLSHGFALQYQDHVRGFARALLSRYSSSQPAASSSDYEAVMADQRRLVRELDVLLNGEDGAAPQASLCDIVAQVQREGLRSKWHERHHCQPAASAEPNTHIDDDAVDHFAAAMKDKLAHARAKGRHGWHECAPADLSAMLRAHVEKGDPRDVANFCMFLWSLGQPISAAPISAQEQEQGDSDET